MPNFETSKEKILRFYFRHRRMPSYAEIRDFLGHKSKCAGQKLVSKMIRLGIIAKDATGRLIPKRLGVALPVRGTVEAGAGWSSPAEEELFDTMTLEDYLIRNKMEQCVQSREFF